MSSTLPEQGTKQLVPPLQNGDRLSVEEFRRRYEAMPWLKKAELIDGVVYLGPTELVNGATTMSSPVSHKYHGNPHFHLVGWLHLYCLETPGTDGGDNSTVRLSLGRNEPQPDAFLCILPSHGGQTVVSPGGFLEGPPELIAEVAATSVNYDLHSKYEAYERNGVREYVVWRVLEEEIDWFMLVNGRYERIEPTADGVLCSQVFPGLWLDVAAMRRLDRRGVAQVLRQGTGSPEHAAFVRQLQAQERG